MIDGAPADFAALLGYVAEIAEIERIRYTTSHPREFTQRLIDAVITSYSIHYTKLYDDTDAQLVIGRGFAPDRANGCTLGRQRLARLGPERIHPSYNFV